jgi:murein L,D-transpeptidase YcbB/YkuD
MTSIRSRCVSLWLALTALIVCAELAQAQEPVPPPDTVATHLQSLLKEGTHPKLRWGAFPDYQARLEELYAQAGNNPLWIKAGQPTPQAAAVIASLAGADAKGLNSADYDAALFQEWIKAPELAANPNPGETALFDVGLSLATMRYASNLNVGRINPRNVDFGLSIEPKKLDLPALLLKLSQSEDPKPLLDGVEPNLPVYQWLKDALARYQSLAGQTPAASLSFPAKFSPGAKHKDVPALRRLLAAFGDLAEIKPEMADSDLYDPDLAAAVKSFQKRHGLAGDAVIGQGTLAQLNIPLADRVRQIQLGLERLRWLPEGVRGLYLIVNIPSFQLYGSRDGEGFGQHDIEMNVIVGDADKGRHTPVFHSDMTYVTFRPYWNVPYQITAKEYLPILRRNPGYLARHNLEIVSNFSNNAAAHAASAGNIQMLASGALKLRQKPGPKNALGLVKFTFPNNNNVYLHSTPSQGLFQRARRDFSHGCIRVEDPVRLAEWVLADRGEWNRERIEAAMRGDSPKTVTLDKPIPVYIFYSTVLADREGKVSFYNDIYGHDQVLRMLLDKGFPYPS